MTYSQYLSQIFPGVKVQKISVNAGFSCPNRDGTIGTSGCSYCRNDSFSPGYCMSKTSVPSQIEKGKEFFRRKYPDMKYLVYFQSYTNTHSRDIDYLRSLYDEVLDCQDVVGLVIGTRPDTLPQPVVALLEELNLSHPVFLEIGAETSFDDTLEKINRHHTWNDVEDATRRASAAGLRCGIHLIAGLPGEGQTHILQTIRKTCLLPIDTIKLHQLQILKGTPLYREWISGNSDVKPFSLDDYLELCARIVEIVPDNIVIERFLSQSPPEMVVEPKWGLKNYQFTNLLNQILSEKRR